MKLHHFLLFIHLAGVVVWVGGMAFAHFCLRPAALALPPAQRLGLWRAVLGRFFRIVWVAIAVIVVSGFAMLLEVGFAQAPRSWHVMAAIGLLSPVIAGAAMAASSVSVVSNSLLLRRWTRQPR